MPCASWNCSTPHIFQTSHLTCDGCDVAEFCSAKCQEEAAPIHRLFCRPLAAEPTCWVPNEGIRERSITKIYSYLSKHKPAILEYIVPGLDLQGLPLKQEMLPIVTFYEEKTYNMGTQPMYLADGSYFPLWNTLRFGLVDFTPITDYPAIAARLAQDTLLHDPNPGFIAAYRAFETEKHDDPPSFVPNLLHYHPLPSSSPSSLTIPHHNISLAEEDLPLPSLSPWNPSDAAQFSKDIHQAEQELLDDAYSKTGPQPGDWDSEEEEARLDAIYAEAVENGYIEIDGHLFNF